MTGAPTVVLHLWGLPGRAVPTTVARLAVSRAGLRRQPGLRFARLLGTGSARTFALRDADPRCWAVVSVWDDPPCAAAFERSRLVRRADAAADERLRVRMTPVSAVGSWAGRTPFAPVADPDADGGTVAALTRARLRWRTAPRFRRAVPAVAADLATRPGLRLAVGIGETPVAHQGTFSIWESAADLTAFAHHGRAHRAVMDATPDVGWYLEDAFVRLAVHELEGTYRGRTP